MRNIIITLPIVAALFAGQAWAGQMTADSLQAHCIPLTTQQNTHIVNSEGELLVDNLTDLVTALSMKAGTIVVAASRSNPDLADAILKAAIAALPEEESVIHAAVAESKSILYTVGPCFLNPNLPSANTPLLRTTPTVSIRERAASSS
ncbi:hypothetical protein TOI97_07680 [Denitrificimonas sp. JX-1]|uniref:Uncharacterized protein n=1 Tax=Denitrificimonas halotolerans TaxID=3098930 RepID=A0ABU5GR38_9GAMM|nr:hypothetical protein [Denitrificimonas sp. JX-1]MDY7219446.1 hypothetical protein [Denitrificimonas sp. JX-1]